MAEYSKQEMEKLWEAVESADGYLEDAEAELRHTLTMVENGRRRIEEPPHPAVIEEWLHAQWKTLTKAREQVAEIKRCL